MSRKRRKSNADDCCVFEEAEESRYFLNPDNVSEHLYCSICQEVFCDPQRAPCGHSFCKKCIVSWLKHSQTCPEDRKTLRVKDLHHDFILENIIGDQMVACPFRRGGCDFIDQLQHLASHRRNCSFNPVNLPDFLRAESVTEDPEPGPSNLGLEGLPTPGRPSLKMRLFCAGEGQRNLLCRMFSDSQDKSPPP